MIASASTRAPVGSGATPIAARAGNGAWKYCAMISLTVAKWARSVRKILSLATSASVAPDALATASRSEEHTSELQSLMLISYAVFCLKKKKSKHTIEHRLFNLQQQRTLHYQSPRRSKHKPSSTYTYI